jgi:hypothetical protein
MGVLTNTTLTVIYRRRGLSLSFPSNRTASLRSLDFSHVPVMHGGHMTIVPGDCDRVPTRFGDSATVSSITVPANARALLEVLRFGGGHVAPLIAWVVHILDQTTCRCLTHTRVRWCRIVRYNSMNAQVVCCGCWYFPRWAIRRAPSQCSASTFGSYGLNGSRRGYSGHIN